MRLERLQKQTQAVQPCSQTKLGMESPGLLFSGLACQGDLRQFHHIFYEKGKNPTLPWVWCAEGTVTLLSGAAPQALQLGVPCSCEPYSWTRRSNC